MKVLESIALEPWLHWWRYGDLMLLVLIKSCTHSFYLDQ